MMHMNNDMFNARTNTGWWRLLNNSVVTYELKHDPRFLSKNSRETIRRWIRSGYCDAPGGEAAKRWRMVMLASRARYHTFVPRNGSLHIRIFDSLTNPMPDSDLEQINAMMLIWRASLPSRYTNSWYPSEPKGLYIRPTTHLFSVGSDWVSGRQLTTDSSAPLTHYRSLMKVIVNGLGHPLVDIPRALELVDKTITIHVRAVDTNAILSNSGSQATDGPKYTCRINFDIQEE